jgi:hypothetical protein
MTTLSELRERVEKVSGPSRALDFEICLFTGIVKQVDTDTQRHYSRLICPVTEQHRFTEDQNKHVWFLSQAKAGNPPGSDWCREAWPLTASVDAALSLVERKLPGWCVLLVHNSTKAAAMADIHQAPIGTPGRWLGHGKGATLPLATLSALLKSLEAANG